MTGREEGVRPAANRPDASATVPPQTRRRWKPDPRNTKALDRHIARACGPEYVQRRSE